MPWETPKEKKTGKTPQYFSIGRWGKEVGKKPYQYHGSAPRWYKVVPQIQSKIQYE